jgi:hypothetical protein
MREVRFVRDFRSRHTAEQFFVAGAVAMFDAFDAAMLVEEGAVEYTAPEPPETTPPAKPITRPAHEQRRRKRGR